MAVGAAGYLITLGGDPPALRSKSAPSFHRGEASKRSFQTFDSIDRLNYAAGGGDDTSMTGPAAASFDSTKIRILDAAETLFAAHGFDGTSVRAICAAAGANVAAVHYHFGGKEEVIEAVIERRMIGMAARREAFLNDLYARDRAPSVHDLVHAMVLPAAELIESEGDRGRAYSKTFAGLLRDRPALAWGVASKHNARNVERIEAGLRAALPQLPVELLGQRIGIAGEAIVNSFANSADLNLPSSNDGSRTSVSRFVQYLTDFIAGGLSAPATFSSD